VRYLQATGFGGPIFPVNPGSGSVAGLRAFDAIDSTPEIPALAVIALPAQSAAHSVALAAKAGVRAALVLADAGIDADERRHELGQELAEIAASTGIRVIGPNTVGYRALGETGRTVWATFSAPSPHQGRPPLPVAIISQGGGLATYLGNTIGVNWGREVSYLIDTGNEADVQAADCLDYVAGLDSGSPRAVGLVLEGPRSARRLVESVRAASRRNVSVVTLMIGRTERGRTSALLHTAAIAGRAEILTEEMIAAGARVVSSAEEFVDALAVHGLGCAPSGRGVGIVSWSGGFGIHAADLCVEAGLTVPDLRGGGDDTELVRRLGIASARNPLDLSAVADRHGVEPAPVRLRVALDLMVGQESVSSLIVWAAGMMRTDLGRQLLPVLLEYRAHYRKPIFLCGAHDAAVRQTLTDAGILMFDMPGRIAAVLANSSHGSDAGGSSRPSGGSAPAWPSIPLSGSTALRRIANESGVAAAAEAVVASAADVQRLLVANPDGLVLKVDDRAIVHKSELGLVELVRPGDDILPIYDRLVTARDAADSGERIVAQEYVSGREIAIGGHSDASMGKSLVVAAGGLYVEFLQDRQFAAVPLSATRARAMIESLRIHPLLAGARGQVPSDVDALIDAIVRVGRWFAASDDVSAFDLNPLIVRQAGLGVKAVDATIEIVGGSS